MTNYFTPSETSCKCGCGLDIAPETRAVANKVRVAWGSPVVVTSGARCEAHNRAIGGAKRSAHLEGLALDLRPAKGSIEAFQEFCVRHAEEWGVRVEDPGSTPMWTHIDLRPVPKGASRVFKP